MSRYKLPADGLDIVVGWDPPLSTFFVQVWDLHKPEDDNEVLWVGYTPGEIRDVDQVVKAVAPWVRVPDSVQRSLYADAHGGYR